MSLPGIGGAVVGAGQSSATTYSLTCGSSAIVIGDPPSETLTEYGYAYNDPTFGAYGSISPTTYKGFPLSKVSWYDQSTFSTFEIFGDLSSGSPSMSVNGVDQLLGSGTFSSISSGTVTSTIASPGVVTWTGHGMVNGDLFIFKTTGALPTGFLPNTPYYVVNKTTNTFQLALTAGGSAINTSGSQSGTHTGYRWPLTTWSSTSAVSNPFASGSKTVIVT